MCGINGIINLSSREQVLPDSLTIMNNQMIHRGPDGQGFHVENHVGFAMRRLAIIDIEGSQQPIFSTDKNIMIVLNGEIYNFKEIRQEMKRKGYQFSTQGDAEVLIPLYQEYGIKMLHKLNGMFAFALYDKRDDFVFIARDRVGIKPLYYYKDDKELIFSSSIDSIKKIKPSLSININAVQKYFSFSYIGEPLSIYENIKKLPPACYMTISKGQPSQPTKWWSINKEVPQKENNLEKSTQEVKELFYKSLELRMRSDVPVGTFLSGGLDSSSIVAGLSELGIQNIHTFSIGFEGGVNELELAKKVSSKFKTDHYEKMITLNDVEESLPELIKKLDEPLFDSALIPSLMLSQVAREEGVKVILNGTGGDEIFGGYQRYLATTLRSKALLRAPETLRNLASKTLPLSESKKRLLSSHAIEFYAHICHLDINFLQNLLQEKNHLTIDQEIKNKYFSSLKRNQAREKMLLDFHDYLPNNILSVLDKTTMAQSIEGRTPFLDYRLVEKAYSIGTSEHLRGGQTKSILRKIMLAHLPSAIFQQKKMGFGGPIHFWLKQGLFEKIKSDLLLAGSEYTKSLFQLNKIRSLNSSDLTPPLSNFLFSLYIFNKWCRYHLEGVESEL